MFRIIPLIAIAGTLFSGCIRIEVIPLKYAPVTNVPEQPVQPQEEEECSKDSTTYS